MTEMWRENTQTKQGSIVNMQRQSHTETLKRHKKCITNRHLGMASPFQLREWKSTRDSRVPRLPLPLHADEHIIQETAASSPAGALAHWPCCHTSIKYRCVGPKDAQTVRLHPANGASTANVPKRAHAAEGLRKMIINTTRNTTSVTAKSKTRPCRDHIKANCNKSEYKNVYIGIRVDGTTSRG